MNLKDLERKLFRIDGRGYKAYKEIEGSYWIEKGIRLEVYHVQSDPFAPASKLRLFISGKVADFPDFLYRSWERKIALQDWLLRIFKSLIFKFSRTRGTGKSGLYFVDSGGQEILARSDCIVTDSGDIEIRFTAGLPAKGRTIISAVARDMLCQEIPNVARGIKWKTLNKEEAEKFVKLVEDFYFIQERLRERGIVSFVADGSILPRRSGVDERPLEGAVPFVSPDSMRVSFVTPNHGEIVGMGIPEGVTLIVGGGFHGKSTLLKAIERGVYPHIPGDGREWVITERSAVKVRSEDGRYIEGVDISPFIHNLPMKIDVTFFSTENASGSTSIAASIIEALEMGCKLLLLDEDTTATNFLIRDARIQRLITKDKEPITPFVDRVRELYEKFGVSTIMVVGGSGDYLDVADRVIAMVEYRPYDYTEKAREIVSQFPTRRVSEESKSMSIPTPRVVLPETFRVKKAQKVRGRGLKEIIFGKEVIDVSFVEQLVDDSQTRTVADILRNYEKKAGLRNMREVLEEFESIIKEDFDWLLGGRPAYNLAYVRSFEMAASLNRMRTLKVRRDESGA